MKGGDARAEEAAGCVPAGRDQPANAWQDQAGVGQPEGPPDATRRAELKAGPHTIEIHQPEGNGELAERITRFGDGPLAVRFTASQALEVAPETIDGARISAIAR